MSEIASLVTAGTGLFVAVLSLWLSIRKANDDKQSALIDDLEARTASLSARVTEADRELRSAMDYVIVLRSQLIESGQDPRPWPGHLSGR